MNYRVIVVVLAFAVIFQIWGISFNTVHSLRAEKMLIKEINEAKIYREEAWAAQDKQRRVVEKAIQDREREFEELKRLSDNMVNRAEMEAWRTELLKMRPEPPFPKIPIPK